MLVIFNDFGGLVRLSTVNYSFTFCLTFVELGLFLGFGMVSHDLPIDFGCGLSIPRLERSRVVCGSGVGDEHHIYFHVSDARPGTGASCLLFTKPL